MQIHLLHHNTARYTDFSLLLVQYTSNFDFDLLWNLIKQSSGIFSDLDARQVVWIEDRSLIELHLSEVTLEQGFQLKIRGNTECK